MHRRPRRSDAPGALTRVSVDRRRALKWLLVPASGLVVPRVFASAGRVASTRVWPAQEYTRVILESPAALPHQVATVANPPRLVLVLPGAEMSPAFADLPMLIGAKKVVAEFEALGLLDKIAEHRHAEGHCFRCDTVVEPRLSDQWFVEMAPLARPALVAYRTGKVKFVPERWGDTYTQWLEGVRGWCVSRQLWWGPRIPVWCCDGWGGRVASREDIAACPTCRGPVRQHEDVLDTWFSSWLVPMASLGWPEETADLKRFYPGTVLITAPEIENHRWQKTNKCHSSLDFSLE